LIEPLIPSFLCFCYALSKNSLSYFFLPAPNPIFGNLDSFHSLSVSLTVRLWGSCERLVSCRISLDCSLAVLVMKIFSFQLFNSLSLFLLLLVSPFSLLPLHQTVWLFFDFPPA